MSVPANDWNNRLKDFISGLAGLVPKIGGILKLLLQTFWPTSYDDIWKLMEKAITDLVRKIVDAEILKPISDRNKPEYIRTVDHFVSV